MANYNKPVNGLDKRRKDINRLGPDAGRISAGMQARNAIWDVFVSLGGTKSFTAWAKKNPDDFYKNILTRLVPKPVELSGESGTPIVIKIENADTNI